MKNILTDGHCLLPRAGNAAINVLKFDGLNFNGLAGSKHQNFPVKLCTIRSL